MSNGAYGFGAGNIPSLAAVEGVNFRHGDIEDTLATLAMASGSFISKLKGGKKFNNLAIKRVYFGNWLRDYSQAIDVGTLSKNISPELIRIVLWIMAFTEFGYGTEEFEVTSDRLGVYRAEEHIDNPKGYAEGEDARTYDRRLRGPVDPRELEIDPQTGMKNYIANERGGNWPTSTEYVRTSLRKCIEKGRSSRANNSDADQYEALRLLGQSLHTLEDFSAHTNYCELVLIALGHRDVFPHVGSNCKINLNGQSVYPIVTGTFGGKDFLHSLLGGAQDSLSQVELGEIQEQLENGAGAQTSADALKKLFDMVPVDFTADEGQSYSLGGGSRSMGGDRGAFVSKKYSSISEEIDSLKNSCSGTNSSDPEDIISRLYPLFEFRDRVMKKIEIFMDSVPFLSTIKEKISDSLTLFVMGVIQPIIAPMLSDLVNGLHSGTEMVVNDDEQFRVWNDNNYDNPTHSQLSKDHFAAYLNEPAGKIATEVVAHVVPLVVKAWEDTSVNVDDVTNEALQVFHHPSLASTPIQRKMRETMEKWLNEVENRDAILRGLTSQGVRAGQNLKTGAKSGKQSAQPGHVHQDGCGHNMGFKIPSQSDAGLSDFDKLSLGGGAAAAAGAYGHQSGTSSYNSNHQGNKTSYNSGSSYSQNTSSSYSQPASSGYSNTSNQYSSGGSSYNQHTPGRTSYGQSSPGRTSYGEEPSSGRTSYGQSSPGRTSYGQQSSPGRTERPSYSSGGYGGTESSYNHPSQSRPHREDSDTYPGAGRHTYGNNRDDEDSYSGAGRKSYGNSRLDDDDNRYSRPDHNSSSRYDSDNNRYGSESVGYGQSGVHNSSSSYGRSNTNRNNGDYEGGYGSNSNRYDSNSSNQYGSSTYGNESRFESENSNEYGRHQSNRFNNDDEEDYGRQNQNRGMPDRYGESQGYHEGSGGYSRY
ncbi:hypothetical protein DS838_002765 [Geotrichum bryndzae]|nr:hypothetical protein DUD61_002991 [Geotrichum candidum]KAI9212333.1 hypothetical protein DS838_002765 [Geotrichum bryndzae]